MFHRYELLLQTFVHVSLKRECMCTALKECMCTALKECMCTALKECFVLAHVPEVLDIKLQ